MDSSLDNTAMDSSLDNTAMDSSFDNLAMDASYNLDSSENPMEFVDALSDNRSLLYVQGRLLLTRLNQSLANSQIAEEFRAESPVPGETQLMEQLSHLMQSCCLDGWVSICNDSDGRHSLAGPGIRLLHRICLCSGWDVGSLLLSLRTAVESAPESRGQSIWSSCVRFAGAGKDAYSFLKKEILGTQCFFPLESRQIQQALILLDSIC